MIEDLAWTAMNVTLNIRWDGSVPGLDEHEVSLTHFGPALNELLRALQTTASAILVEAEDPEYGAKGGKRHKFAKQLDVRIQALERGSAVLRLAVQSNQAEQAAFAFNLDDLAEQAALRSCVSGHSG